MTFFFIKDRLQESRWQPRVDVYRTSEGWVLKFDVAGIQPADIEIGIHGSRVEVKGVRRDRTLQEGWHHYSMEIAYTRFERVVELPCELAGMQVKSECRDGMLLVYLRSPL